MTDKDTVKDLIARVSTIGEILKMMPGAPVDDAALHAAIDRMGQRPGLLIGEALLEMRVITLEQHARALELQKQMRELKGMDEVAAFFDEVRKGTNEARDAVFEAIPNTNPGVTT